MSFDYSAQPKQTVSACNLCGGHRFDRMTNHDRYDLPVTADRCRGCGLVFLNPRMTAEAYRAFYKKGYYRQLLAKYYGKPVNAETIEAEQAEYAQKLGLLLAPHFKARRVQTLLDVGGSTGVVAQSMERHFNLEATVLEIAEAEAKRAEDKGLRVIHSTIEDHEPDGERFDLVLLCQTIDHLLDIAGSLRTIRALMEDDGLLFVDCVVGGEIKVDHPFYLDHLTMSDYFRRTGFRVLMSLPDPDGIHANWIVTRA